LEDIQEAYMEPNGMISIIGRGRQKNVKKDEKKVF
jgi:uncharacterized membrane protein YcaP (DUF421 family)